MDTRNEAVPFGTGTASDAKWHMIAAIYDREMPPDELLPMLLEAQSEAVYFAAEEICCTANATWTAVSYDADGNASSVTGSETAERCFLHTGHPERLHTFLSGIDRSQRAGAEIPDGMPVIPCDPPEESVSAAECAKASQEAESRCRKSVPGVRYEDFDAQTELSTASHTLYLPVFRIIWTMYDKSYCAYIDGRDLTRMCLPTLPIPHRPQRMEDAEAKARMLSARQELQEQLDTAEEEWSLRIRAMENDREKLRIRMDEEPVTLREELETNLASMQTELTRTGRKRILPSVVTGLVGVFWGLPALVCCVLLLPPILPLLALLASSMVILPMVRRVIRYNREMETIRGNMAQYRENHAAKCAALEDSLRNGEQQLSEELNSMQRQKNQQLSDLRAELAKPVKPEDTAAPVPRTAAQTRILELLNASGMSDSAKKSAILDLIVPEQAQTPEITACISGESVV